MYIYVRPFLRTRTITSSLALDQFIHIAESRGFIELSFAPRFTVLARQRSVSLRNERNA